jgi:hypothetical protein
LFRGLSAAVAIAVIVEALKITWRTLLTT